MAACFAQGAIKAMIKADCTKQTSVNFKKSMQLHAEIFAHYTCMWCSFQRLVLSGCNEK